MAAVAVPPVWADGREVLVQYNVAGKKWHARIILAYVGDDADENYHYVTITPDSDSVENQGARSREVLAVLARGGGRAIPFGVRAADVYDFALPLTADQIEGLVAEAQRTAAVETGRLGFVRRADAAPAGAAFPG